MHSLICFKDGEGHTINFFRLKYKRPATVLQKVYEGFCEYEWLYLKELRGKCTRVTIHYTMYGESDGKLTYQCNFDEFMENYNAYKQTA